MIFFKTIKKNLSIYLNYQKRPCIFYLKQSLITLAGIFAIISLFLYAVHEADKMMEYMLFSILIVTGTGTVLSIIDTTFKPIEISELVGSFEKTTTASKDYSTTDGRGIFFAKNLK